MDSKQLQNWSRIELVSVLVLRITTINAKLSKIACLSGEEFISYLRLCSLSKAEVATVASRCAV